MVKAIDSSTILVTASKQFYLSSKKEFRLYRDGKFVMDLFAENVSESVSSFLVTLKTEEIDYQPGIPYELATKDNYFFPIDFSYMAQSDSFEEKFKYDGRLGSIYSKDSTTFTVFAPFATRVILNVERKGMEKEAHLLSHHLDNGIHEITLKGDYDGAKYTYSVTNFGVTSEVCDPYSFSLDSNGRHSFVIDEKKVLAIDSCSSRLSPFSDMGDAIIYETNIRDLTSLTDLDGKGSFDALLSTENKTEKGKSYGIDYIASLGITHVQLQPTMDFQTVDEDHPLQSYNWGYDPNSYFAPEGSFSTHPDDPYDRLFGLRKIIAAFHRRNLRVVQDVVYNHLYSTNYNMLCLLVPGYYLRKNMDGTLSNGTGCGNDFETRIYMARKLIIDSMVHYVKLFDIDGFRFDLMGIIDIKTLTLAKSAIDSIKPGMIFYGEGWDLSTALSYTEKGTTSNASELSGFAFFNDRFRDIVKGKSGDYDLSVRGYLLGDTDYVDGFEHTLLGSSRPLAFAPLFETARQSLNFVECHDNHTLYDKIKKACPDDSESEIERRIKMFDMALLFSSGIPFFHEGQEVGQSKKGHGNTYNLGDSYNGLDYGLIRKKRNLVEFLKDAIALRNRMALLSPEKFYLNPEQMSFEKLEHNALHIIYHFEKENIHIIFNPNKESFLYAFDDYVRLIFNEFGDVSSKECFVKMAIINALGCFVFLEKKGEDR